MLADLGTVQSSLDKARRTARTGDREAKLRVELLEKCEALLDAGNPVRGLVSEVAHDPDAAKALSGLSLLTAKRVLYVANVDEADPHGQSPPVAAVRQRAEAEGGVVVPVCAKIESELAELDEADQAEMLESLGLDEPALSALTRGVYKLLGLQSYFTAGPKEIKAWTIPIGATGPQAAGVIHSDFERGFIRAEVYGVGDLEKHSSESAIRAAGKLRVEGKGYIMQDGDVCHFLFNV